MSADHAVPRRQILLAESTAALLSGVDQIERARAELNADAK
ncbi:hypothetical protein [Mycobacterium cookii]|nr:hypothetical protein [Mycobacterium cookii]